MVPPEPGGNDSLRSLLEALEEAEYRVVVHSERRPLALEVRPLANSVFAGFAIYVRTVEPPYREQKLSLPRHLAGWERGLTRVMIDHIRDHDLYVALPPGRGRSRGALFMRANDVLHHLEKLRPASAPVPRTASPPIARSAPPVDSIMYSAFEVGAATPPRPPVTTGFAPGADPARSVTPRQALEPSADYFFWLGVGVQESASIEKVPTPLPEQVRDGVRLLVELYEYEGELTITNEARGQIEIGPDGRAKVVNQAAPVELERPGLAERLFFRVRTPGRPGRHRLRCNIYLGSTLLQSRLVSAAVGLAIGEGISSVVDYRLSDSLHPVALGSVPSHDFSLEINGDKGSHQFRFYRQDEEDLFKSQASVPADRVKESIDVARRALRMVSWKSTDEWNGRKNAYRYARKPSPLQFAADLGNLAVAGSQLYSELARQLADGVPARRRLEKFTQVPGKVQIASGVEGLYVPAGLFYDHDVERPERGRFELCKDFAGALGDSDTPLEECSCMLSGCNNRDEPHVVCPSGFWGFRHELGWPTSTEEPGTELEYMEAPGVLVGLSTDSKLERRQAHLRKVKGLLPAGAVDVAEDRATFDRGMRARAADVLYLYCHGGIQEKIPYLSLGRPDSRQDRITYDHLRRKGPWGEPPPRPLVFINGCHTSALGPDQLLDLVAGFVEEADAAGVIGTELTVFEPLACTFAEELLGQFLRDGACVGAAVRHARLELLRVRNPLGLVYVPFVAADTRLCRRN